MMKEGESYNGKDDNDSENNDTVDLIDGESESNKLSDYSSSAKGPNSFVNEAGIVKKGFLTKKGRKRIFRPWVLRTIILDDRNILSYYDGRTLKGTVLLEGTTTTLIPPDKADGKHYAFEITNISNKKALQTSNLILAASSEHEADEWVEAIFSLAKKQPSSKANFQYESFEVSYGFCIFPLYSFIL
jgi:hypothetical protein